MTRQLVLRKVLVDGIEHVLVTCGCQHFTRKKCQCRHFYAVVNREPCSADFSPECLKSYELYYGDKEDFTQMCDETIARSESYGGLLIPVSLADFKASMKEQHINLDWYVQTYNDIGIDTTKRYCDDKLDMKMSAAKISAEACSSSPSVDVLGVMADPKKQSAYSRTNKSYLECTEIAASEEDVADMLDTLSQLRGRMLGRKSKAKSNILAGRIGSLPALETRKTVQRKKPHGEM